MSTTIESIIRRKGGTKVTLGGTTYHFTPDDEGRHVAEVSKNAHIQRFLSITEGFRLLGDDEEGAGGDTDLSGGLQPNEDDEPPTDEEMAELRARYQELTDNDGEDMSAEQLEEAIEVAEAEVALDDTDTETDTDADQGPGVVTEPKPDEVPLERQDPAKVDEAELRARFEEVIGEKAHPRMKVENIQARIIETVEAVEGDD